MVSHLEVVEQLRQQNNWLMRKVFGEQSERRLHIDPADQLWLGESIQGEATVAEGATAIVAHTRKHGGKQRSDDHVLPHGLRFDDRVPVITEMIPNPMDGIWEADEYTVVGEKETYHIAQKPSSYCITKTIRQTYKHNTTGEFSCADAAAGVFERSCADASFLANTMIDKFVYYMPLYRQHQRLQAAGIEINRGTLTALCQRSAELLRPVYDALLASILSGDVVTMDETPIKAGKQKKGKMRQGYFWPIYGEDDEIVFHYASTREHRHVQALLGDFSGTLLSDGYEAYAAYARNNDQVTHAQCWRHCRRGFERAQESEPGAGGEALAMIGALYRHEQIIRDKKLCGEKKRVYRMQHSEPIVQAFWRWCDAQCQRGDLLPSSPLAKALKYAMSRQVSLQVFLSDQDVPIDTNHLERGLRAIPMGKKNRLFCWTEIGAERVAAIQSLLVACKLHGVNPYTYLVDVLQRISEHPASQVVDLTPRVWKTKFSHAPMKSDLVLFNQ